eukprot:Nitzschia sp. Nitz4//scaffold108_size72880//49351//51376//NITZ4_005822-RA/size72880-augustus-gene-0.30-mRNA-1//-1//CDS//3329532690//1886//frame0
MAAPIKMDELLVSWLGSDEVYESVLNLIEKYRVQREQKEQQEHSSDASETDNHNNNNNNNNNSNHSNSAVPEDEARSVTPEPPKQKVVIPPFYPLKTATGTKLQRRRQLPRQSETWDPLPLQENAPPTLPQQKPNPKKLKKSKSKMTPDQPEDEQKEDEQLKQQLEEAANICVSDQLANLVQELGLPNPSPDPKDLSNVSFTLETFVRVTKEICRFPSFFNGPLFQRILDLWQLSPQAAQNPSIPPDIITGKMLEWYWKTEMEPFDPPERFFRLVKQPEQDCILRDDFLPYIKALLNDHPGLEFLSNHAEFQEKYAVTVITRIFYSVNKCHSGRITSRQVRRSDLLEAFAMVDEEEDINKVTRYFSYEHFYVLYCRFWELDHDRDYRITREDLLKYGDHSLSHMIVDRIFDAAPRPFAQEKVDRTFLSYEDFIYFMLSEEDKANDVSVHYWFSCVDVDGDAKLNNMEMRSFYAVQLHRMQCMGHEIVPFEDMLCQMMDMIKPANPDFLVVEDFLQKECSQVSGALFDALFNLNKYLMFEQRDPFVERQKREDEFETDWDRFACIDYNRLAMEEEAREEEAMEIDWVTVDDEEDDDVMDGGDFGAVTSESPF